jgi:hypothetical protein
LTIVREYRRLRSWEAVGISVLSGGFNSALLGSG